MKSAEAYAPSTARHINRFDLVCELVALLLFIPQFPCVALEACGADDPGGLRMAALAAVLGTSYSTVALGRFLIGLTTFRLFGLVRHWKNMWISDTFHGKSGAENCTYRGRICYVAFILFTSLSSWIPSAFLRHLLLFGMDSGSPLKIFSRKKKFKVSFGGERAIIYCAKLVGR